MVVFFEECSIGYPATLCFLVSSSVFLYCRCWTLLVGSMKKIRLAKYQTGGALLFYIIFHNTWRIISGLVSDWVTPIEKPIRRPFRKGTLPSGDLFFHHGDEPLTSKSWDDPLSVAVVQFLLLKKQLAAYPPPKFNMPGTLNIHFLMVVSVGWFQVFIRKMVVSPNIHEKMVV